MRQGDIARVVDDAVNTIEWVSGTLLEGDFDLDEVIDRLSFASVDLMDVADDLRELAGESS